MLPFTTAKFFETFGAYNHAIWPMQIAIYALALPATFLALRSGAAADRLMSAVLGLMWGWAGIVYHWLHFSEINRAALIFGMGFVAQGAIFFIVGTAKREIRFAYSRGLRPAIGLALIFYAGVIYPILGIRFGHGYPNVPLFGVTPCPVTIFTFGCLLLLARPIAWWVVALPLLWSAVGGSAAFLLDVPQDWLLLLSGVATVVLMTAVRPALLK